MKKYQLHVIALALLLIGVGQTKADLIVNGGFETGDFTGWTQVGNTSEAGVSGIVNGVNPYAGNFQAYFGAVGSLGGIEQNVTTTAGQSYQLSFALYLFSGTPNEYVVSAGGTTLTDVVNSGPFGYTVFTYNFTASSTSTTIEFEFQENPSAFLLDNVTLNANASAVPEPATTTLLGFGIAGLAGFGWRKRKIAPAVAA